MHVYRTEENNDQVEIFNAGSEDWIDVKKIAELMIEEMHLPQVKIKVIGGVDGVHGWKGNVKHMGLDITKIRSAG